MAVDINIPNLIINKITKEQYNSITKNEDELYFVVDEDAYLSSNQGIENIGKVLTVDDDGIVKPKTPTTGVNNYNDLTNKPQINGNILSGNKTASQLGFSTVATTGSYNDLTDIPDIPSAQVNADWNATSGVAKILHKPTLSNVAVTGSYDDLIDKPSIPAAQVNADWSATSGVSKILNKPSLSNVAVTGNYDDLTNKPTIPAAQQQTDWDAISGITSILHKPELAEVATSGSYTDLINKPSIPAAQVQSDWTASSGVSAILHKPELAPIATSGSFYDLVDVPSIPGTQVNADWDATSGVAQILHKPNLSSVATSGDYNDLSNKPEIPLVDQSYNDTSTHAQSGIAVKEAIDNALSTTYKPAGSIYFSELPALTSNLLGNVYQIKDSFTTTAEFHEGAGNTYAAGTYVAIVEINSVLMYDILSSFVDLSTYQQINTAVTHTNNTQVGSTTQPVYVNANGTVSPIDYTIAKSVPSDAKFTDTLYTVFSGAGTSEAGTSGLVPQPLAGDNTKYLRGDGSWTTVEALPSQTGNTGKFLSTNGSTASWQTLSAVATSGSYSDLNGTPDLSGAISTVVSTDLDTNKAIISDNSGKIAVSTVTSTELGYLSGTTSSVQTQLNNKQATLVSGTNIKTINNNSLLGSGNIDIDSLPAQTGYNGKFLSTNGTNAFWNDIEVSDLHDVALNTLTTGQVLSYNGTSWINETKYAMVIKDYTIE